MPVRGSGQVERDHRDAGASRPSESVGRLHGDWPDLAAFGAVNTVGETGKGMRSIVETAGKAWQQCSERR